MDYQQRLNAKWDSLRPYDAIADPSEYVMKQTLREAHIYLDKIPGVRRELWAYVINPYPGGKDGVKFEKVPHIQSGMIVIRTDFMYWGCAYEARVIDYDETTKAIVRVLKLDIRSHRSPEEQVIHMRNIIKLIEKDPDSMANVIFHRDINLAHYPEMRRTGDTVSGILRPTRRTKSGHPSNIAFDLFEGIYFTTSDSLMRNKSYYAPTRIYIPQKDILGDDSAFILTDMHCYGSSDSGCPHYLTISIVKRESAKYNELISLGGLELDVYNNPFLVHVETGGLKCATQLRLRKGQGQRNTVVIEIMLIEKEVEVTNATIRDVEVVVRNNRTPRASVQCDLCNTEKDLSDSIFA